jgi:hypothetical protein
LLNTANFLFSLLTLVFLIGNAFARRAEGHRLGSQVAFVLAIFALVICLWNYTSSGASAPSGGYTSGEAVRILARLDSLDAHVRALRQDVDVVQRRVWYLSKGQEQAEVLQPPPDSLNTRP